MYRIGHIAVSLLLLFAVTGVSVHTHYCGGAARYTAVAIDGDHSSCCGDEMPACASCLDEVESKVLATPTTVQSKTTGTAHLPFIATLTVSVSGTTCSAFTPDRHLLPDAPPGVTSGSSLPILNSSFLI